MYELINTEERFLEVLSFLQSYILEPNAKIALDLETYFNASLSNLKTDFLLNDEDEEETDREISGLGKIPKPVLLKDGKLAASIRTIQIGLDPQNKKTPGYPSGNVQFIFDCKSLKSETLKKLKPILENVLILGQNLKYDYQFLFACLDISLKKMIDVMLMSQVLYAGDKIRHGLADLYSRFLDYSWFITNMGMDFNQYKEHKKVKQKEDWSGDLEEEQLQYAADDVYLVFYVLDGLLKEMRRWKDTYEYGFPPEKSIFNVAKLEFSLIPVYALMELRGIKLDTQYHSQVLIPTLEYYRDEAEHHVSWNRKITVKKCNEWSLLSDRKVHKIRSGPKKVVWEEEVEEPINLVSWVQLEQKLNEFLSSELGEEVLVEGTGEEDIKKFLITKDIRERLSFQAIDTLEALLRFKKAKSLLSKFGRKFLNSCTDRGYIHPSWFQIGTDDNAITTGRSSCKDPNLQQIPSRGDLFSTAESIPLINGLDEVVLEKKVSEEYIRKILLASRLFRRSFIAEEGWVLIDADYSQIEPRIAAEICQETGLIQEFINNSEDADIHGLVAKALMRLDKVPEKGSYERDYIGKTAGLSLLYGTHWLSLKDFMFSKTEGKVVWDDLHAEEAYNNFFRSFPNFKRSMAEFDREIRRRPEEAGGTLAPFKSNNRPPFAVSTANSGRARRFCLKPEHLFCSDYELSKHYELPKIIEKEEEDLVEESKGKRRKKKRKKEVSRKTVYKERLSSAFREGFNFRIQGLAADILKIAALKVHHEFIKNGFHWTEGIVALVHDEILVHVTKKNEEIAKEIIERCMKEAGKKFLKTVPLKIDCHIGASWSEAKS